MRELVITARLGVVAIVASVVLASGCLFDPRDPEPGGGPVCFEKITQASELNVFANLDGSFRCRQSQSYLEQFAEDFVYVPAPSVLAQNPGLNPDLETRWDLDKEQQFVDLLFSSSTDTIIADVYDQITPPQGSTEILFEGDYSIVVVQTDGSEIEYSGSARITMRQERAIWLIARWEEEESARPLGELKTSLVQ